MARIVSGIRLTLAAAAGGAALVAAAALAAEHETERMTVAGDVYTAGEDVTVDEAGVDDVFAAGDSVTLRSATGGSAHLAGRRVWSRGAVGGDLYAAGWSVEVAGPVTGDATAAGSSVRVDAEIGGDARLSGADVVLLGAVGGGAVLAGEHLVLGAPIAGDAVIAVRSAQFEAGARIDGRLTLYAEDDVQVPASVIPADRIDRRAPQEWREDRRSVARMALGGALAAAVAILLTLAIAIAVAPDWTRRVGEDLEERPVRKTVVGFVALAAMIGAVPLFFATLVGAPLAVLAAIVAAVFGFGGYVLGVYVVGDWAWGLTRRLTPERFAGRMGLGLLGLVLVWLVALIPFLGWLFVVLLTLAGVGAIVADMLRGRLYAPDL